MSATNATIDLRPIAPTIAAEVAGIDLARLDDRQFAAIRRALLDHLVLVFRDQHLSPEDHLGFARRFGELEPPHPVFAHLPEHPQVSILENKAGKGINNDEWHTDVTFRALPAMGSILYARVIPPSGGDTLWASMYAAYEALAGPIKAMIGGLSAVHDVCGGGPFAHSANYREIVLAQPDGRRRLAEIEREFPPVSHPVVRTHPETGRRALFVNRSFTTKIEGLSKLESSWLLGMLVEQAEQTQFQMRHRWRVNDLVMWDNRCTQHLAISDYAPAHRLMHRITVLGDRPFFRAEEPGRAA
jgi:taurine dioxygenase